MHVLLIPFGSSGDVHPIVGVGVGLARRGHRVTVAANGHFRPLVERERLEYVEVGAAEDYLRAMQHPDLWHPTRAPRAVMGYPGMADAQRRMFETVRDVAPDVVVGGSLAFGARVAREKLGTPLVTIHLQPALLRSSVAPPVLGPVPLPRWLPESVVRS